MKLTFAGKYNIILFSIFFLMLLVTACNDSTPPTKNLPNEMFADLTGVVEFKFQSPGWISSADVEGREQIIWAGTGKRDNVDYGLVVSIFFMDRTLKTGTFNFVKNSTGITTDYAVGGFMIGEVPNKTSFISDSGSVTITEITSNKVRGTFYFYASDSLGTSHINVLNGILSIN